MYTLVKTYGLPVGSGTVWTQLDAAQSVLSALFQSYQKLRIQVHESYTDSQQVVDLYAFSSILQNSELTLADWLQVQSDNNVNLRGVAGELSLKESKMYSYDAITVDFLPRTGNTAYHPTNNIPTDERTDILLTRPDTDYVNVGKHCLFTVGGYVHPHVYGKDIGVYIVGGNSTTLRSNESDIGVLDFSRIGELEILPLKADLFAPPATMLPYREEVYTKLPRDLQEDETLGLVVGGYLHLLDGSYDVMSNTTVKIRVQEMSLYERYFRSRKFLDLSSMDVLVNADKPLGDIVAPRLLSDAAVTAWLTHPCSFWVYIKNTSIKVTQESLPRSGVPGQYFLGKKPEGAVRADLGELPAYIQTLESPIWILRTRWGLRKNTLFETMEYKSNRVKVLNDTPYLHQVNLDTHATLLTVHHVQLVDTSVDK